MIKGKSGTKDYSDFPPEWRMLPSVECRQGNLWYRRRWALFERTLLNKVKACARWDSIPMSVHSVGAAKQNGMNSWEWWWILNGLRWSAMKRETTRSGLARLYRFSLYRYGLVLSPTFCSECPKTANTDSQKEGISKSHSTFWKSDKFMDCLSRNN